MPTTNFPFGIAAPGIANTVATSPLALPQSTTGTIFTITGGPILVEQLFGIVTAVIGSVANATKLQYLSADTTPLTAVDLCATADVNALAEGAIYSLTGVLATGAIIVAPNTNQLALGQATKWNIGPGVIRVNCAGSSGAQPGGGKIQWYLMFRPYANFTPTNPGPSNGLPVSVVTAFG